MNELDCNLNKAAGRTTANELPRPRKTSYKRIDCHAIRDQLNQKEIAWQTVLELFESTPYRPWATKSWKEMRSRRIDSKCSTCGGIQSLVLQHTRQPPKPSTILRRYESRNRGAIREWLAAHPPKLDLSGISKDADACPKCGSQVLRYRKLANDWVCVGVQSGVACGHQFSESVKQVSKWVIRDLEDAHAQAEKLRFFDETGLGLQAVREALSLMIRYLTMKDTRTLCKKCAFIEDRL